MAALAATTALTTPSRAHALPLFGFVQGLVAGLSGSALIGGTIATSGFTAGVVASASFGAFAGTFAGRLLVGAGLSYLSRFLTPQPSAPEPSERLANFAQPVSYAEFVLGRTRKGGPLGFTGFADDTDVVTGTAGKKRHYSPILAAHPCEGIVTHYIDERVVETDTNGLVTTAPMAGYYRIRPFLGQPGQVADPELVNAFSEITSAFDFAGLTGAHIWALRPPQNLFSQIYPTGRQGAYTPVIDGHNGVYDPRSGGSTGFTRNAALLIAHWLVNILGQSVDWAEVSAEADICDQLVSNKAGSTQPRWRIDGVLSDDQEFEAQRAQMGVACDAWFYERSDGKVGFKVGRWIEPTITVTGADFLSIEISSGDTGRNAPTEVAGKYIEPANAWREAPSGPYIAASDTRQVKDEPTYYMISSHNQASRINKRIARTKRAEYRLKGTIGAIGHFVRGQRFIRVQHLGIDEVFEVGELWMNDGWASFDIVANSVKEEDFDFVAATEEPDRPAFEKVSSADDVDDVAGLSGAPDGRNGIIWTWTAPDPSYSQQIRFRKSGDTDWEVMDVPLGESSVTTSGLEAGSTYQAQARNRTATLREGAWKPDTPAEATVTGVAPGALTVTAAASEPGLVRFTGTAGTATTGLVIYHNTIDDFSTATQITGIMATSPLADYDVIAGAALTGDLVINGGFDADSNWTKGTGWTISGGVASRSGSGYSYLTQSSTPTDGVAYRFSGDLVMNSGEFTPQIGGTGGTTSGADYSTTGPFAELITAPTGANVIRILGRTASDGSVDNIRVAPDDVIYAPCGPGYYWIVPISPEGVQGTEVGSYNLTVP